MIFFAENYEESLFVRTKHGGHLGYFKGGWLWPENETLVEDYILEFIEAVLDLKFCDGLLLKPNEEKKIS